MAVPFIKGGSEHTLGSEPNSYYDPEPIASGRADMNQFKIQAQQCTGGEGGSKGGRRRHTYQHITSKAWLDGADGGGVALSITTTRQNIETPVSQSPDDIEQ